MAKTMVDIVVFCGFFITFAVKLLIQLVFFAKLKETPLSKF